MNKWNHVRPVVFFAIVLILSACTQASAGPATAPTAEPTISAPSLTTPESSPTEEATFETILYRNDAAGFEFVHPAGWTVGPDEIYARGGITAFTSWERPADVLPEETPPGETRLDVTVLRWDPESALDEYIEVRLTAWEASAIAVLSREDLTLSTGQAAVIVLTESIDGNQGFFFLTTLADRYLILSGEGDIDLLAAIAATVRVDGNS